MRNSMSKVSNGSSSYSVKNIIRSVVVIALVNTLTTDMVDNKVYAKDYSRSLFNGEMQKRGTRVYYDLQKSLYNKNLYFNNKKVATVTQMYKGKSDYVVIGVPQIHESFRKRDTAKLQKKIEIVQSNIISIVKLFIQKGKLDVIMHEGVSIERGEIKYNPIKDFVPSLGSYNKMIKNLNNYKSDLMGNGFKVLNVYSQMHSYLSQRNNLSKSKSNSNSNSKLKIVKSVLSGSTLGIFKLEKKYGSKLMTYGLEKKELTDFLSNFYTIINIIVDYENKMNNEKADISIRYQKNPHKVTNELRDYLMGKIGSYIKTLPTNQKNILNQYHKELSKNLFTKGNYVDEYKNNRIQLFYAYAYGERNPVLLSNIQKISKTTNKDYIMVVLGEGHFDKLNYTPMQNLFEKNDISYVIVKPEGL